jgi:F0F1-type ATP synthase membrane subunit b/b'
MILKYDAYTETLEQQQRKQEEIQALRESFNKEMIKLKEKITKDVKKEVTELLVRLKPDIIKEGLLLT